MKSLRKLSSLFSHSVIDINKNDMGVKGKNKNKFSSDIDIYGSDRLKNKASVWTTLKATKKTKGK